MGSVNALGISITTTGIDKALETLSPSRARRAMDAALGLGVRQLIKEIRSQSRVDSGYYKAGWQAIRVSDTERNVVNDTAYTEYVTGRTQATTPGEGRRRGASAMFMRKIRREQSPVIRRIMQERMDREYK